MSRIDLGEPLSESISDLEVLLDEHQGKIAHSGLLPTIEADAVQIRLLFQNLLSNALKFHHPDRPPRIEIHSQRVRSGHWQIRVTDNGIGFSMDYADRIFGMFQRLHGRDDYAGTGIGLATCRKIVERPRSARPGRHIHRRLARACLASTWRQMTT